MGGGTRRLTTAQAVVAFLRQQYIERDADRGRFISGVFGIFGHGNVAGMGEALETEAAAHGRLDDGVTRSELVASQRRNLEYLRTLGM